VLKSLHFFNQVFVYNSSSILTTLLEAYFVLLEEAVQAEGQLLVIRVGEEKEHRSEQLHKLRSEPVVTVAEAVKELELHRVVHHFLIIAAHVIS